MHKLVTRKVFSKTGLEEKKIAYAEGRIHKNSLLFYFSIVFLLILITWKHKQILSQLTYFIISLLSFLVSEPVSKLHMESVFFAVVATTDILVGIHQEMAGQAETELMKMEVSLSCPYSPHH